MDLFDSHGADALAGRAPLAERLRPESLEEVVGQERLTGAGGPLRAAVQRGRVGAVIFWGPPGTGKTTLARALAGQLDEEFVSLSAVTSGVRDLRAAMDAARERLKYEGRGTIVFVDEVHRFNKAQQDALLPAVEEGLVDFVGATTENPSFEVTAPLLSRSRVFRLEPLSEEDLRRLLERGREALGVEVSPEAEDYLLGLSGGDGRRLLNALEAAVGVASGTVSVPDVERAIGERSLRYGREEHYDVISAFIKSVRGSDPDAALHYLARMIEAGEDPVFMARRVVILASEDIGNADPHALPLAIAAAQAVQLVGMPEGRIPLAQATTYLASAPKSNASYTAIGEALADVRGGRTPEAPLHLRNARTGLMKDEGYGAGYRYAHDEAEGMNDRYLPEELAGRVYYEPRERGEEVGIKERLDRWRRERIEREQSGADG